MERTCYFDLDRFLSFGSPTRPPQTHTKTKNTAKPGGDLISLCANPRSSMLSTGPLQPLRSMALNRRGGGKKKQEGKTEDGEHGEACKLHFRLSTPPTPPLLSFLARSSRKQVLEVPEPGRFREIWCKSQALPYFGCRADFGFSSQPVSIVVLAALM